jgi:protein TonB
MAHHTSRYGAVQGPARFTGAAVVVALHAALIAALWQLEPVRSALSASPIMVSLLTPPREKVEALPKPLPPKPRVQRSQPLSAPPILTVTREAPAAYTAPPAPAEPAPAPPVEVAPPAPVIAAAPPAPAPAPVVPPRFNADYLNNPEPAYPPLARRMGEEGKVVLRVFVNDRGLPEDVQLKTSSGSSRLDGTAQQTVKQWKFIPARRGETPVGAWVLVPISFSLRS